VGESLEKKKKKKEGLITIFKERKKTSISIPLTKEEKKGSSVGGKTHPIFPQADGGEG